MNFGQLTLVFLSGVGSMEIENKQDNQMIYTMHHPQAASYQTVAFLSGTIISMSLVSLPAHRKIYNTNIFTKGCIVDVFNIHSEFEARQSFEQSSLK